MQNKFLQMNFFDKKNFPLPYDENGQTRQAKFSSQQENFSGSWSLLKTVGPGYIHVCMRCTRTIQVAEKN